MAATLPPLNTHNNAILFDVARHRYYSLDAMAETVWRLIQRPMTLGEIAQAVAARFEIEPEEVERDLPDILSTLESEGLIQVEED